MEPDSETGYTHRELESLFHQWATVNTTKKYRLKGKGKPLRGRGKGMKI